MNTKKKRNRNKKIKVTPRKEPAQMHPAVSHAEFINALKDCDINEGLIEAIAAAIEKYAPRGL